MIKEPEINYWMFKDQNRSDKIEEIIKDYFGNYLKEIKKRNVYIRTLSFVMIHLFIIIDELNEEIDCLCDDSYNIELMKDLGIALRHHSTHKETINYSYGEYKLSHKFINDKILPALEEMKLCVRDKGHNCKNKGYNANYELGFTYFNIKRIYQEIYLHNDIQIERNNSPIIVKIRDGTKKKKYVTLKEYPLDEFERDKEYIQRIRDMYDNMKVSLTTYEDDIQTIKDEVDNLVYEKIYAKEKYGKTYEIDISKQICGWNRYLRRRFTPYRVYHLEENTLRWGRVYGNQIDCLPNIYKPLLMINGESAMSVDIKSSVIQFYMLNYYPDVNNEQDFYKYDGLEKCVDRGHMKLIAQCLNFNTSCKNAHRAYIGMMRRDLDFDNMMDFYEFSCVYRMMIKERSYLSGLFLNEHLLCKDMFMKESEFMIDVTTRLMDLGIPFISNFDAVYVRHGDIPTTIDVFYETSNKLYNKNIYIEYNKELYEELSN